MSVICFVLPKFSDEPVGGYRVVYTYASHLARNGHDVVVCHAYLFSGSESDSGQSLWPPLRLLRWLRSIRWAAQDVGTRPAWFDLEPRVQLRMFGRLSRHNVPSCDVLVATAVLTAPVVAEAAVRRGIRGMYLIQGFEEWTAPRAFVEDTWRLPLKRVVIAPWLSEIGDRLGVETVLVPNAIDPTDMPAGPPMAQRGIALLAMVSGHEGKRTDLVVSVMNRLASSIDGFRGTTFGLIPRPVGLAAVVEHIQNPDREVLRRLFQEAQVYLCASDAEGWHLPPAEAMASGAAVVSTDIGGVRAYADGCAVFVQVGDADAMVEAVTRLLREPQLRQELADLGQTRILRRTPDDAAEDFARVLFED